MWDGRFVFVDIDTQRDFLEPTGALFVAGSAAILPHLALLTACARARGIPVLATACAHTLDEPDPEPFPPHCLVGTRGQQRVEATSWPEGRVIGPDEPFDVAGADDLPPHLTLQKRRYDLFSHPDAHRIVARYGRDRPTLVVYGVATDYCVRAAVLGLVARGHRVAVVVDAVRAVVAAQEPEILTEFAQGGAVLTLTEVICRAAGGST
jgi:nicotinamidase/pyrazinamidase